MFNTIQYHINKVVFLLKILSVGILNQFKRICYVEIKNTNNVCDNHVQFLYQ
jgi:hypothetical protein